MLGLEIGNEEKYSGTFCTNYLRSHTFIVKAPFLLTPEDYIKLLTGQRCYFKKWFLITDLKQVPLIRYTLQVIGSIIIEFDSRTSYQILNSS